MEPMPEKIAVEVVSPVYLLRYWPWPVGPSCSRRERTCIRLLCSLRLVLGGEADFRTGNGNRVPTRAD